MNRADPLHLIFLKDTQKFGLCVQRELLHFIQQNCAVIGLLEFPRLSGLVGAREGAGNIAEQFGFNQVLGDRGTVDFYKGFVATVADVVNCCGEDFLPCSGFSGEENRQSGVADSEQNIFQFCYFVRNPHNGIKDIRRVVQSVQPSVQQKIGFLQFPYPLLKVADLLCAVEGTGGRNTLNFSVAVDDRQATVYDLTAVFKLKKLIEGRRCGIDRVIQLSVRDQLFDLHSSRKSGKCSELIGVW